MSYSVLVEPADDKRQAFARWCLAQDPPVQTATASGSELSSELFKNVPEDLLVGAYVDGRLYRHVVDEGGQEAAPLVDRLPQAQLKTTRRRKTVDQ